VLPCDNQEDGPNTQNFSKPAKELDAAMRSGIGSGTTGTQY
jgi:hypothetical protein